MARSWTFAAIVYACAALTTGAAGSPAAPRTTTAATDFAAGSLIIPMDTDTSTTTGANHAPYNQNNGMWRAYGLLDRLLQNGIPVRWSTTSLTLKSI